MVQWFKSLLAFLFKGQRSLNMDYVLTYNIDALHGRMESLTNSLVSRRDEESWKIVREIIVTARNIAVLELSRTGAQAIPHAKGRIEAFSDLVSHMERAFSDSEQSSIEKAKKPLRGERRIIKLNQSSKAGPAI